MSNFLQIILSFGVLKNDRTLELANFSTMIFKDLNILFNKYRI